MEVPAPKPGSRQLLVRVRAAGLNPVDFKTRMGDVRLRLVQPYRLPVVLGNELAGEVMACGDEVQRFRAGDRVFARVDKDRMGGFAEFAVVEEDHAALIPASLDFANAAAVPLAGLTALQALRDELHVASGQRIFISGGAGGVGSFAIQIAKHLGAQVATTASPRGEALVRQLGCRDHRVAPWRSAGTTAWRRHGRRLHARAPRIGSFGIRRCIRPDRRRHP